MNAGGTERRGRPRSINRWTALSGPAVHRSPRSINGPAPHADEGPSTPSTPWWWWWR